MRRIGATLPKVWNRGNSDIGRKIKSVYRHGSHYNESQYALEPWSISVPKHSSIRSSQSILPHLRPCLLNSLLRVMTNKGHTHLR